MTSKTRKIYTKTGDRGETGLFSGERVQKNDLRIEAYGTVDELSSFLGVLKAALDKREHKKILAELASIQSDLFCIGARLASYPYNASDSMVPSLDPDRIRTLEQAIDNLQSTLEPIGGFILPGGHPTAAWAHVCRTVCRRAERRVVELAGSFKNVPAGKDDLGPIVKYLNRLSDYLFMLARYCNVVHRHRDVIWEPPK